MSESIIDILEQGRSHTPRVGKVRGVRLAIVVDNKDGGDNPGFHVKVKYPWMNDQDSSFWARIAVPMGGNDRGVYMLPEPDDQLLVVFEHGDIHRPIVIGAVWSSKQQPVENNTSGKNNTKLIKSRAGHRVIFDDKQGSEQVTIVDKTKKNKIVLDAANKVVTIESDADIEVKAKQNVIVHAQSLKLGTAETLTGKAESSLLVHAAQTFGLKASSQITIDGQNVTINVSNSPACQTSGSGAGALGAIAEESAGEQVQEQTRGGGGSAGTADQVRGSQAARAAAQKAANPPKEEPTPEHVYVINTQLQAPGGNPLAGEEVVLVKHGTDEVIAGPFTTDDQGGIAAILDENQEVDVQIVDDGHPGLARTSDDSVQAHLHVGIFENGTPLAGEAVTIKRPDGSTFGAVLDGDGMLDLVADHGEHEISIRDQTFHVHTLTGADLADGGSHYEFAVPAPDHDFETARANRYHPDDDDKGGG